MIKLKGLLTEEILDETDLVLPRGKKVILQAEDTDYKRGLIIKLKEDGGYDVQYWAKEPSNIVSSEIKVDDEKVTDSGKTVYLGFHPEYDED